MAPKKAKPDQAEVAMNEELQNAMDTSRRLQELAKEQGMLSSAQRIVSKEAPYPKALLKADEKDLVKKSTQRKGRYMLNICAQIAPAAASKLGSLAQLDSQNPVLYIDFPQGRLKFYGTIVFPKTNYMLLKFGSKDVLCEDVFENMIVFPEAHWIGTKDENPSEKELPMPVELQTAVQHTKYSFAADAGSLAATQPSQPEQEMNIHSDEDDDDGEPGPSQGTRASGRLQGSKRPRYAEPGVSDDELEAADNSDEEEPIHKLPKLSQASPGASKQHRLASSGTVQSISRPTQWHIQVRTDPQDMKRTDISPADSQQSHELLSLTVTKGRKVARQSTLTNLLTNVASQSKARATAKKPSAKAAAAEVIDLLEEEGHDQAAIVLSQDTVGSMQLASAIRPRRARASLAKSLKETSSEDDEVQSVESLEDAGSAEDSDEDYDQ